MEHGTDELRDAPNLKKLAGHDPFVVPDGFFGRFPHSMAKRVAKPASLRERLLAMHGIAFVLARPALVPAFLLVAGATFYWALPTPVESNNQSTEVLAEFDPTYWEDQELVSILYAEPALGKGIGSGLATEDLEEYLEREELTLEQLTELL
ncbi:MAG: hypothetical protein WEC15_01445 [Flavobacteriales bacterium]